jgi:hypothetical protein
MRLHKLRNAASGDALFADLFTLARVRAVMGTGTAGAIWTVSGTGSKRASRFELASPADIVRLRAYLDGRGATTGSQAIRGVVYADNAGQPGPRVASTAQVTIPAGRGAAWVDLPFTTAIGLRAGHYWLALQSGATAGVVRYAASSRAGALRWNADAYSDGPATPFGTASSDAKELSIHAIGG